LIKTKTIKKIITEEFGKLSCAVFFYPDCIAAEMATVGRALWRVAGHNVALQRTFCTFPALDVPVRPVQAALHRNTGVAPAAATMRHMSSRADVINPKKEKTGANEAKEATLRSPGAFGGSGGCGTAAPKMTTKLEQKAIEELDDMSIVDDVSFRTRNRNMQGPAHAGKRTRAQVHALLTIRTSSTFFAAATSPPCSRAELKPTHPLHNTPPPQRNQCFSPIHTTV